MYTGGLHGPSTAVYTARELVTRVHSHYTAMYTACTGSQHDNYTAVYRPSTAIVRPHTGRPCNVSCTRPCNVSYARYTAAVYTAREHVFARENGTYTAV